MSVPPARPLAAGTSPRATRWRSASDAPYHIDTDTRHTRGHIKGQPGPCHAAVKVLSGCYLGVPCLLSRFLLFKSVCVYLRLIMSRRCRALSRSRRNVCILRYDSMSLRLRCLRSLYLTQHHNNKTEAMSRLCYPGLDILCLLCVSYVCGCVIVPLLLSWPEDEVWVGVVDGGDGPELAQQRLLEPLALAHPVAIHLLHHLQGHSQHRHRHTHRGVSTADQRKQLPTQAPLSYSTPLYRYCMSVCVPYLSVGSDCL